MKLSDAIKQKIINLTNENNISLHKLSLDSGIPYSTLSSFINGKSKSPTIGTLLHICEGLGIELHEFFNDALFIDVQDE